MKRNTSGITLLKSDTHKKAKFWWNPEITENFLNKVLWENREWKIPPEWDIVIFHYNDKYHHLYSKYTINRDWEIKSLKWEIMKPFFHPNKRWPRIRLQIEKIDKNGKSIFMEKEIWILQMMEKIFGSYFPWYKLKCKSSRDYILVPKDGNYNNMKYDNLQYLHKNEYYRTKKNMMKEYLLFADVDDEKITKLFHTTIGYVKKIKQELVDEWYLSRFSAYQEFQKEIWIEFSEDLMQIYQILMECQWQLSNLEIVKILRHNELWDEKKQHLLTNKVVRVRKKLTDKWLIPRFNEWFESKREKAVKMIEDKINSGKTNQEIADILWLKKEQIDNLARWIKKRLKKSNQ